MRGLTDSLLFVNFTNIKSPFKVSFRRFSLSESEVTEAGSCSLCRLLPIVFRLLKDDLVWAVGPTLRHDPTGTRPPSVYQSLTALGACFASQPFT